MTASTRANSGMHSNEPLLDAFRRSYKDFSTYPINLIAPNASPATLEIYHQRLWKAAERLFTGNSATIKVPFTEFDALGRVQERVTVDDDDLKKWLGDREKIIADREALEKSYPSSERMREPKCRFVFFLPKHSRAPLNVTREMFCRILSYHQVNPSYINFCLCFGLQGSRVKDFRSTGFQKQTSLNNPSQSLNIPLRGRSGFQFQLSYKLSAREPSLDFGLKWEPRQLAVHHQFDVIYGTSLWIITSGRNTIQERIHKLLKAEDPENPIVEGRFATQAECFKTSLAVHLENCSWAVMEWQGYISHLEDEIETLSEEAINEDKVNASDEKFRKLQSYENDMNEAILILQANSEVLLSIQSFYEGLTGELNLPWIFECQDAIFQFSSQISGMLAELKMHIPRGNVLLEISGNREELLKYRIQAEANEKMQTLIEKMQKATEQGQKEAVAMKTITVITLIYLPATFVSTLFSTDIVRYDGRSQSFSELALQRWIEVTVPLTIVTLVLAVLWNRWNGGNVKADFDKLCHYMNFLKRRRPDSTLPEFEPQEK